MGCVLENPRGVLAAGVLSILASGCGERAFILWAGAGGQGGGAQSGAAGHDLAGTGGAVGVAGSSGATGSPSADCAAWRPGSAFDVCAASYLGGAEPDRAHAVDLANDGTLLVAATTLREFGVEPVVLLEGAGGVVLRMDATGRRLLGITRIGSAIFDLEVARPSGRIAVAGDFGVAVLQPSADALTWRRGLPDGARRVAIDADDRVAALGSDGSVTVFDDAGELFALESGGATVNDVALDATTGSLFVTGSTAPASGCPLTMPFVRAYDRAGSLRATAWGFADGGTECAASAGNRVAMGADGKLYYAAQNEGGNTVHRQDPTDLSAPGPIVSYDAYSQGYGRATDHYAFVARFDPASLAIELGQFILPRDAVGEGGTWVPSAVTADEQGRLFVGGAASCCSAGRDALTVSGQAPGPAAGVESSLVILSPDFTRRESWVTWTAQAGAQASIAGVLARRRVAAVVGAVETGDAGSILLREALQPEPGGALDGWFSVWSMPAE